MISIVCDKVCELKKVVEANFFLDNLPFRNILQ